MRLRRHPQILADHMAGREKRQQGRQYPPPAASYGRTHRPKATFQAPKEQESEAGSRDVLAITKSRHPGPAPAAAASASPETRSAGPKGPERGPKTLRAPGAARVRTQNLSNMAVFCWQPTFQSDLSSQKISVKLFQRVPPSKCQLVGQGDY